MKRHALVLVLALVPHAAAAQQPIEAMTPAGAYAQGAQDGRAAARARAGAPGWCLGGIALGLVAGRLTPRTLDVAGRTVIHVGFAGMGLLAGDGVGPIAGERSFLDRDSARIAPMPDNYRYGYEEAYRAEFASIRHRDTVVAAVLYAGAAIALATLRHQ